jgi:hypothetical protein
MRKLSLNIDDLQIESFSVEEPAIERGTVLGHLEENKDPGSGTGLECTVICLGTVILCTVGCYTIWLSCHGTCDETECGSCHLDCGL